MPNPALPGSTPFFSPQQPFLLGSTIGRAFPSLVANLRRGGTSPIDGLIRQKSPGQPGGLAQGDWPACLLWGGKGREKKKANLVKNQTPWRGPHHTGGPRVLGVEGGVMTCEMGDRAGSLDLNFARKRSAPKKRKKRVFFLPEMAPDRFVKALSFWPKKKKEYILRTIYCNRSRLRPNLHSDKAGRNTRPGNDRLGR